MKALTAGRESWRSAIGLVCRVLGFSRPFDRPRVPDGLDRSLCASKDDGVRKALCATRLASPTGLTYRDNPSLPA